MSKLKLIIQIPCYDEAETLPDTLATIPRAVEGVDVIEVLVVDDGSTDGTAAVASSLGVDHVVRHKHNLGLAAAFKTGLQTCLALGADIIVNTDGDNQYPQERIPDLVRPIVEQQADMVIGTRNVAEVAHFSPLKRLLQSLGSRVVRVASGVDVPDATSGFRAISRDAAMRLNVFTDYTYTLETLIQAGRKGIRTTYLPIQVNAPTRPSRLVGSSLDYVRRSLPTIVRLYVLYQPLRTFSLLSLPFALVGVWLVVRFFFFYLQGDSGHVQSVVIGSTSLILGFLVWLFGLLADLVSMNRRLLEEILYQSRRGLNDERDRAPRG